MYLKVNPTLVKHSINLFYFEEAKLISALTEKNHHQEFEWVSALSKGDETAFDQLFQLYGKRLYYFAYGYLKSADDAEEVVQEVFLKVWNYREKLNPELSFKAFLFKIAFRHIRELFRKLSLEQAYRHSLIESLVSPVDELNEQTNYQSLLELVEKLIDQLPPRQKDILIKKRKLGMPVKEIAAELDISAKTVENHITEALKTIKKGLEQHDPVAGSLFFLLFLKN